MTNRILTATIHDRRLDPIESELDILVRPERITAATEVRGRFVGPKCVTCSTLEVAYPIRQRRGNASDAVNAHVVLPEASFWDPERPFLYHGAIELWEDDTLVDCVHRTHGLRTFRRGSGGLRINGQPFVLQGIERDQLDQHEAAALRRAGCNLLLASVRADALWTLADQLGFVMLGRIAEPVDLMLANQLGHHPCALGWVFPEDMEQPAPSLGARFTLHQGMIVDSAGQVMGRVDLP